VKRKRALRKLVQEQHSINFDKFDKHKPKANDLFQAEGSGNHKQFQLKPSTLIFQGILSDTATSTSLSTHTNSTNSQSSASPRGTTTKSHEHNHVGSPSPPDSPTNNGRRPSKRPQAQRIKGTSGASSAIFQSVPFDDSERRNRLERRNTFDQGAGKGKKAISPRRCAVISSFFIRRLCIFNPFACLIFMDFIHVFFLHSISFFVELISLSQFAELSMRIRCNYSRLTWCTPPRIASRTNARR
jgi:hypothetical protein